MMGSSMSAHVESRILGCGVTVAVAWRDVPPIVIIKMCVYGFVVCFSCYWGWLWF